MRRVPSAVVVWSLCASGCSVGAGEGSVTGMVTDPECELDAHPYDLEPTFFGANAVDSQLEIRIQRGSDFEGKSDGMAILVTDAERVKREMLGLPIEFTGRRSDIVRAGLYLNDTCPVERDRVPTVFDAVAGSITFLSIYAPMVSEEEVQTEAQFTGVHFVEQDDPDERHATLSGSFRFLYNRGRPGQRFP